MKRLSILILMIALLLSGCQLARTDIESSGDRLVGMLITREYLDLFDMEAYLNDNLHKLGANNIIDADTDAYQGRIYAEEVPETLHNEEGETVEHSQWTFPELEGVCYFAPRSYADGEGYINSRIDDAIIDGHTYVDYKDEGEHITLEGTVILAHSGEEIPCYFNPVYQTADGRVYVVAGSGMFTTEDNAPGALYSQSISDTTTRNVDGKIESFSTTVTISMETAYPPETYVVVQMDEDNSVISENSYTPGEVPEELEMDTEASYILLETRSRNSDGTIEVTRELYDETTETLKTLYCREDGFMGQIFTTLIW